MKKTIILLSLVLIVVVSLLATTLFKPVSYEVAPQLQKFLDENNMEIASRVSENLYLTTNGSYIQGFPMKDDSDAVNAATFLYDTTSADGHVNNVSTTYSATHDSATGTVTAGGNTIRVGQEKPTASTYSIYRGALFFNTSAIPDNAIISEAGIYLETGGDYSERDFYVTVVYGGDLETTLDVNDYGDLADNDAVYSALSTNTSFTAGSYSGFYLNPAGVSQISINSTTAFGLRSWNDIIEQAPTGYTMYYIYPTADEALTERTPIPGHLDNYDCYDELTTNYYTDYTDASCGCGVSEFWEDRLVMGNVSLNTSGLDDPIAVHVSVTMASDPVCVNFQPCRCHVVPLMRINGTTYSKVGSPCYWAGDSHQNGDVPILGSCTIQSTTFSTRTDEWATNPDTSAAWNWSDIDDIVGVAGSWENVLGLQCYISTYQIGVEYLAPNSGREFMDFAASEQVGSEPYLYVVYTVGNVPNAPTDLLCNDEEYPVIDDFTPYFSAVGHHDDAGATMNWYSIQIDDTQSFASPLWSSGQTAFTTNISDGERCENIEYSGLPFSYDTRYYWRIAFYDQDQDVSSWSTTSWFDFRTPLTCPDDLVAEPLSHNEIRLTWDNADSTFTYGALYYKTTGYPSVRSDGTRLYLGPGEAYTHRGLDAGTNYYYRVWGYDSASSNYSTGTCYASDWATTLAGETDGPTPPLVPPEWSQYPTCEVYEGIPFIHDLITDAYATNGSTTHYDVPDETACLLCTFGFLLMFGLTGYFVTRRNELVLVGILCVGIIAASIAGAMPMWFIAFAVVGAIYLFVKVRA